MNYGYYEVIPIVGYNRCGVTYSQRKQVWLRPSPCPSSNGDAVCTQGKQRSSQQTSLGWAGSVETILATRINQKPLQIVFWILTCLLRIGPLRIYQAYATHRLQYPSAERCSRLLASNHVLCFLDDLVNDGLKHKKANWLEWVPMVKVVAHG